MSGEEGSDADDSISNDGEELFSEDFDSDLIEDTLSSDDLTVDSELEDTDNSFEEESIPDTEDEYTDDSGDDEDDEVYKEHLQENLKRYSRSSVAFPPLAKRRRPSSPDLFMKICDEPLTPAVEAAKGQGNPEGTVLQPVAESKTENLDSDADLEPCNGGAQEINNGIISFDQPAVEAYLVLQQPVDSIPTNDPNGMNYPVSVGIESIDPNMVTPYVYIPPNLEIPEMAELVIRNNNVIMNNPTFEENKDNLNPPVYHNFGIPVILEVLVNNNETMNYPLAVGNNNGHQNLFSSTGPAADSEIKEVVLVEMPVKTEVTMNGNKQTVYRPALLGNVVPPDPETIAACISSDTVIEKLVLVEVPLDPENIEDDSPETLTNPIILQQVGGPELAGASFVPSVIESADNEANNAQRINNLLVLENDGGQTIPCCISVHSGVGATAEAVPQVVNFQAPMEQINVHGNDLVHVTDQECYLGDPRRTIRLANFHLVTAKNKPTPTYAACYLANVIFSEEILLLNSIAEHNSRYIFMDQNKMLAIREYLLTVFPNHDLREEGKDWEDCISAISFMIECLYAEAEVPTNRNLSVSVSSNWCTRSSNDDAGEGPSQWLQDVRESVKRETEEFEHIANPEGTRENPVINPDQLVYLGDPSRDVRIPYSALDIEKSHLRPDLAAKYIILHLFPEEVLIESNVYGNMECGLFALDPNRIDALREFLQDNYPEYDLQETGYHWKLCVTAINSCLLTLRQGARNA